jgi:hypothetical protein
MRGRAVHCGLPCFLLFAPCVCPAENVFCDEANGSYFVKIFRIFGGRELRIFVREKYILLQREYGGIEYATICAYFYTSPTPRWHICINMQLGL